MAMLGLIALLVRGLQQQRRREHALQISETKFASIIALATDTIISIDRQQRITVFNRGAEQTFGYKASEVLGQPLELLLPPSFVNAHAQHVEDFVSGIVSARYMGQRREIVGMRKGGEQFPAEASISKIEVQGEPLMTVVLRDISERCQREHEERFLASAAEVLAESLDSQVTVDRVVHLAVPELADCCALYLIREQTLVLAGLAHAEQAASRQLHELLRQHPVPLETGGELARSLQTGRCHLQELLPTAASSEPKQLAEPYGLMLRQGFRSQLCVPLRVRSRNIGALLLLVGPSGRRLGEGEVALAEELGRRAALALDNTLLYAEAQSATRSRDEMLGIVAHDPRSPVNTLSLSASVMLRRMKKQGADADQLHGVEVILQSTRRMNRLIEDLLDVVRMEAGRLSIQRSRWPVAQLVRDAAEAHQAQCTEAHVELKVELPEGLPVLNVDADRIQQVFTNLLGNALKFTPAGGAVTLAAALQEGSVVFHVSDSGPGMPPEHLAHVFDRFWQARSTDRRGAGLGLAIAKGIIEAHGGRIWARSKPGEGSTFSFALPPADSEGRSEPPAG
jgi:PAS domain S-box-containing protein